MSDIWKLDIKMDQVITLRDVARRQVWVLILVVVVLVVTGENKINSYFAKLKFGQVCMLGVEFDNCTNLF